MSFDCLKEQVALLNPTWTKVFYEHWTAKLNMFFK